MRRTRSGVLAIVAACAAGVLAAWPAGSGQPPPGGQEPPSAPQRAFAVEAKKYAFSPPRIEVEQDDLVTIRLTSTDIPHSFTIDEYRIAKRVGAGQTVTFEFRASQPGTFRFYCNLRQDERCRDMHGQLVVHGRKQDRGNRK